MGPLDIFFHLFLQLLVNEGPLVSLQPCKLLKVIAESWLLIVKPNPCYFEARSSMSMNDVLSGCLYYSQPQPPEKSHYEILSVTHTPLTNVLLMASGGALGSRISTENTLLASQCIHLNISRSHFP